MVEPKVYELHDFSDLLKLEDDQIDRLCAELPEMMKKAKQIVSLFESALIEVDESNPVIQAMKPLKWIDDGKQDISVTLACGGNELGQVNITH